MAGNETRLKAFVKRMQTNVIEAKIVEKMKFTKVDEYFVAVFKAEIEGRIGFAKVSG